MAGKTEGEGLTNVAQIWATKRNQAIFSFPTNKDNQELAVPRETKEWKYHHLKMLTQCNVNSSDPNWGGDIATKWQSQH